MSDERAHARTHTYHPSPLASNNRYVGHPEKEKWVIPSDVQDLQRDFNESAFYHCSEEIPHAFVMTHSDLMADKTWRWLDEALHQ